MSRSSSGSTSPFHTMLSVVSPYIHPYQPHPLPPHLLPHPQQHQHQYQHHHQHQQQQQQQHQNHPHYQPYFVRYPSMPHREDTPVVIPAMNGTPPTPGKTQDAAVAQALEIARESPDGASDPTVSKILETALTQIWNSVQEQPDSYIMTRDEFAVFNFFQHRFVGNRDAVAARKRFWDNCHA